MQIGPYPVTRGAILPYSAKGSTKQKTSIDGDGGVVAHEVPFGEIFFRAVIHCSHEEGRVIAGYLRNGVRYSAVPFTFVDGFGTSRLVRFWDNDVNENYISGTEVELDLLFREEVAP